MTAALVSNSERQILAELFTEFADGIERVDVFGSRATGAARSSSDIDLVIYGDLDMKSERRLWTILEDSNLPVSADIVVYSRITNDLLKKHIDAVGVPLFTRKDLQKMQRAATKATSG